MRDLLRLVIPTLALLGGQTASALGADFSACIAALRADAMAAGVSASTYDKVSRGLTPNDAAYFLDTQPEFTTPVWDYLDGLVD